MSGTPFSNVNNIHVHSMIPEDQKIRLHNDVVEVICIIKNGLYRKNLPHLNTDRISSEYSPKTFISKQESEMSRCMQNFLQPIQLLSYNTLYANDLYVIKEYQTKMCWRGISVFSCRQWIDIWNYKIF